MSVLRTDRLRRAFGSLVVTNDVNLTVEAGERHVIIGPNGDGKTSLINQIGGQLAPSAGRIFVKDTDITGWAPNQVSRIGVARTFQRNNLFQNLSVIENLRLAVQARRGRQLEIGIALAGEPELLLLDEPTSGMSPAETTRMIDLIAGLPRALSILMIEHDMDVVFSVADRITVLYYGKILATGTPAEIQANARVQEVYLGMA